MHIRGGKCIQGVVLEHEQATCKILTSKAWVILKWISQVRVKRQGVGWIDVTKNRGAVVGLCGQG